MSNQIAIHEQAARRRDGWDKEYVFVNRVGNPHRNTLLQRFYVVCKRAGITDGVPNGSADLHALQNAFISLSIASAPPHMVTIDKKGAGLVTGFPQLF